MTTTTPSREKPNYKDTLNLPQTPFPMKANLVQNEAASQKRWQQMKLYDLLREHRQDAPRYSFHDGPPYANGSIHLGHLLNKVLKDIIVRWKSMQGFDVPYVPGWDCHGLPIEHKVVQELGEEARSMQPIDIRRRCRKYAEKYIKLQSQQMQRLLTLAQYDDPYLTMNPKYEAAVLEVFAQLVGKGLVYRGLKPVHWSIANRTALAEAELEYEDRDDTSVYVLFQLKDPTQLPADVSHVLRTDSPVNLMIWTTTPWTLPANLAVAVHPDFEYGIYYIEGGGRTAQVILAAELADHVLQKGDISVCEPLVTIKGSDLLGVTYQHPFIARTSPVVAADYVTLRDEKGNPTGTGMVHTAPGHGTEDYQTGLREGLDIYCPVQGDGTFDRTAPDWLQGRDVWQANGLVVERLRQSGHLFYDHVFTHSYPHDWRSKTPVIFRATEQWFVAVDDKDRGSLRDLALKETAADVKFFPEWGRNRMRGMLESRPDWCLSRQRAWGLPIPVFFDEHGNFLLTQTSVQTVADFLRERGSDAWFKAESADLLAGYDVNNDPDAPQWLKERASGSTSPCAGLEKSSDIFDVWFESGSSWNAVIRERFGDEWYPIDLYLEGSDQHRGWFQLSLLPALGVTGKAPFKNVLTHGFMVDKDGKKMSKSLGNALEVDELMKNHGADVCRWWVSSLNTDNDIKVDEGYFKVAGEEYRKVRNTIRFLLSNLSDFNEQTDRYEFTQADSTSIDAWAMGQLNDLLTQVTTLMEHFHFRRAHEALFGFCNDTLSAVYLAATKDRLYCDSKNAPRRRRTQTAMYDITRSLLCLLAPILPHTTDEAWRVLMGDDTCIHTHTNPQRFAVVVDARWEDVFTLREIALKAIEDNIPRITDDKGTQRKINPLDIGIRVKAGDEIAQLLKAFDAVDLADLLSVSRLEVQQANNDAKSANFEIIDLRDEPRCDRSWKRDGTVCERSDGGMLSQRDAQALNLA